MVLKKIEGEWIMRSRNQAILPRIPMPKDQILRLKITLEGIRPPIWRKIDIPNTYTFHQLHYIIQIAFGWQNSHLHEFMNGPELIGDEEATLDSGKLQLKERLYEPKQKLLYLYDFGDNWEHKVQVEKIYDADEKKHYPLCVSGKRATPPEDVGGIWGYAEFMEIMADPAHPEHEEMAEWYGGDFDPEEFSRTDINVFLRGYAAGMFDMSEGWEE